MNFEPTPQDRLAQALEHIEMLVEEKGGSRGIKEARKHIAWYIKGLAGSSRLKGEVFKIVILPQCEYALQTILINYNKL